MLTHIEREFLRSHRIDESLVFACGGMTKRRYQQICDLEGYLFVSGASPCRAGGHTLRSKHGHCIVCDTARIGFALRAHSSGYVYLFKSEIKDVIKVGFTKHQPERRLRHLNMMRYGSVSDWMLEDFMNSMHAGRIEILFHDVLRSYIQPLVFDREGLSVTTRETYKINSYVIKSLFDICRGYQDLSDDLEDLRDRMHSVLANSGIHEEQNSTEQARVIEQNRRAEQERLDNLLVSFTRSRFRLIKGFEVDFYKHWLESLRKVSNASIRPPFSSSKLRDPALKDLNYLDILFRRVSSEGEKQLESLEQARDHWNERNASKRILVAIFLIFASIFFCIGYYLGIPYMLLGLGSWFLFYSILSRINLFRD